MLNYVQFYTDKITKPIKIIINPDAERWLEQTIQTPEK